MIITSDELYQYIEDAIVRRVKVYKHMGNVEGIKTLDELLIYAQTSVRYYMLTEETISEVWNDIRNSGEEAVDIITDITASLIFSITSHDGSFKSVAATLAGAVSINTIDVMRYSDIDYAPRALTASAWHEVFLSNPWLLTLYLLKLMGLHPELLIPLVVTRKVAK